MITSRQGVNQISAYEGSLTFSQKSMKKKRECVEEGSCSDTFCQRV